MVLDRTSFTRFQRCKWRPWLAAVLATLVACDRDPNRVDLVIVGGAPTIIVGDSLQLVADARHRPPFAIFGDQVLYTSADRPSAFLWQSSDSAVVSIGLRGVASGESPGEARISATSGGARGPGAPVTVVAPAP